MENFDRVDNKISSSTTLADIPGAMKEMFGSLDSNRDKFVSKTELQNARANGGDHLVLVNIFDANISALEELSNDEWGDENNGITRNDIQVLGNKIEQGEQSMQPGGNKELLENIREMLPGRGDVKNPKVFGRLLQDYFSDVDKDGSGDVSLSEVEEAICSTNPKSELHVLSEGLKFNYERLAAMTDDTDEYKIKNRINSVTWEDIHNFRYGIDPDYGFKLDISKAKIESYEYGGFAASVAVTTGAMSGMCAAIAVANPEPFTKVFFGCASVALGSTSLLSASGSVMVFQRPGQLQKQYDQRRKMLESWSYFRD